MDFFGIGTQKSGTTWLHHNLNRIPEFSLLPIKEVHYFDRSSDYPSPSHLSITLLTDRFRNKTWRKKAFREILNSIVKQNWKSVGFYLKWNFSDYSDKWYLSLFKKFHGYTGEITPSYSILNQEDIAKIYKLIPNVRLVLMLRNPIDRAWSHYRYSKRNIRGFDFEKVSNKDIIKFMESEGQILRSDYIRMLDNYSNIFPNEQILIGFYDAIIDKPSVLLNDIIKHISGDTTISIEHLNLKKVVNNSPTADCPTEIKDYLKSKYHTQIKDLSEKFGGYCTKWYENLYIKDSTIGKETLLLPTVYMKS